MAQLYLTFKDNELTATIDGIATTDTIGLEGVAEFFGWDGYSKTIVFYQNPRKPYRVVCHMDEFSFTVPHEVLTTDGPLAIGAFGVTDDGKRKVSTLATVVVTKGMYDENAIESIEPTPTEYEQMLAFMNAYMEAEHLVDSVAEAAEQATEIAKEAITVEKNVAIEEAKAEISNASKAEKAEIETLSEEIIERAEGYADAAEMSSIEAANSVGRISSVEKRLSNIEQSITPSPFVVDDSVAYAKAVPVNALPYAEVNEIGGMCAVKDGALVSAPVTEEKSVGKNLVDMERFYNPNNWSLENANNKYFSMYVGVLPAGTYKLTAEVTAETAISNMFLYVVIPKGDGSWTSDNAAKFYQGAYCTDAMRTLTLDKPTPIKLWTWDSTYINLQAHLQRFLKIQIERGSVETEYEPYKSISLPIPDAVRNLEGYGLGAGAIGNTIYFDNKTYVRKVGAVDLGTLPWSKVTLDATLGVYVFASYSIKSKSYSTNCVCKHTWASLGDIWGGRVDNAYSFDSQGTPFFRFSEYTDAESFRKAMSGVMLVYELAEPIVEDISDILPLDNYIEVFEGGVVYMENEHKLAVPNKITYQIKEVT